MLERSRSFPPGDEDGLRDDVAPDVSPGIGFPDRDDAIGVAIRQRLEHHAAHHAERRRRRADAQGKGQDGRNRKSRRANKRPQREPQVLKQRAHDKTSEAATKRWTGGDAKKLALLPEQMKAFEPVDYTVEFEE